MSYSILYRSMFVKLSDGRFIPLYESGDNNVYDVMWNGHHRRSRDWHQWAVNKMADYPAYTRDEIMASVERMIDGEKKHRVGYPYADYEQKQGVYTAEEIEKNWGYYAGISVEGKTCSTTSAQMIRNFFRKGFEQAVSFVDDEDLKLELRCTFWNEQPHRFEKRVVKSEEEFLKTWQEMSAWGPTIWVGYYLADRLYERHRTKASKREPKKRTEGYVVTINSNYISSVTSRRFHCTGNVEFAHIYSSRATAEKLMQRIQRSNYTSTVIPVSRNDNGQWEKAA